MLSGPIHHLSIFMNKSFLSINVSESEKNVDYWAARPYVDQTLGEKLRRAEIFVLPWEDFRDGEPILFPNGTADVQRMLLDAFSGSVALLATPDNYKEIALHANVSRWPMLLVKQAALPILLGVMSNELDSAAFHHEQNVELRIVIATQGQQCVQIEYKGPANDAVKALAENAAKYCPQPIHSVGHGHQSKHEHKDGRDHG